jgi:hypothetical protein
MQTTSSPLRTVLRVIIGIVVIIILIFLSIGIVRLIPRLVSSIASSTVSITDIFGNDNASSTNSNGNSTSTNNGWWGHGTSTNNGWNNNGNNSGGNGNGTGSNGNGWQNATSGTPDLAVSVISTGNINPKNGIYTAKTSFTSTDTIIVKFRVENHGTAPSGSWKLNVSMPTTRSSDQLRQVTGNSIPAGGFITAQAVFTGPKIGSGLPVTITVDPNGLVMDSDRSNNSATVALNVTQGYTYSGYGNGTVTGNNIYGQPDLTVQISQVGTLDQFNRFVPTASIPAYGRVAVQFRVTNQGNNSTLSAPWFFRSEMTNYPNANKIYNSDIQPGLIGGQSVNYTISFDNVSRGANTISLFIDSQNNINELNENNNFASVGFNVY